MNETAKWILINLAAWFALGVFIFLTKVFEDIRNTRWRREDAHMKAQLLTALRLGRKQPQA